MMARVLFEYAVLAVLTAWRELAAFAAAGWLLWPAFRVDPLYGPVEIGLGRSIAAGFLLTTGVALYAVRRRPCHSRPVTPP